MDGHTALGQSLPKVDGLERVTGQAVYGADVSLPGMLHGKILRSPHPHARIKRIDFSKALRLPGVAAVVTAGDLRHPGKGQAKSPEVSHPVVYDPGHEEEMSSGERPSSAKTVFASNKVLWVGQAVAAVAANSLYTAEEALELIEVDYELLPAVTSVEEAMKPDAPLLHPMLYTQTLGKQPTQPSNVATLLEMDRGNVEDGFKKADAIIEDTYRTAMVHQGYIEPRATLAKPNADGKLVVWSSSQGTFGIQAQLSQILKMPHTHIKVIPTEIGGGFGSKTQGILEPIAALLALKTGKPIKMVMARHEEFQAGRPGASSVIHLKMGATRDGKIVAADMTVIMDGGAFPGGPVAAATTVGLGRYNIPDLHIQGYDVVTNKPPVGAYRAPGAPQTAFAVESHLDRLAENLGIDPLEIRLKNVSQEGDELPNGVPLPRVGFQETLEAIKGHPAWTRPISGKHRGRGLACGMWIGGRQPTSATLKLNSDGTLSLNVGVVDLTGTRTAFTQMVAEEFGISPEEVIVLVLDTHSAPYGPTAAGSKTTYIMSVAIKDACDQLKEEMLKRGAEELDLPTEQVEYESGRVQSKADQDRSVGLSDLGQASVTAGGNPIIKTGRTGSLPLAPSFAAHIVDVEVDPDTGKVTILKYTAFQDCGFAINPMQVEGQVQGGVAQGIGWALNEAYDFKDGIMQNPTWLDYRMPTALDLPMIEAELIQVPNPASPYGVRGTGEIGIVTPMGAIANAIARAIGVRLTELPMNPERVLLALTQKD